MKFSVEFFNTKPEICLVVCAVFVSGHLKPFLFVICHLLDASVEENVAAIDSCSAASVVPSVFKNF